MNIIVLTSSMADADFNTFAKQAQIKPNPSNQNFYNKLIRSLAYFNNVSVVSLRPFVKGMFDDDYLDSRTGVEGTVKYYYPYVKSSKSFKASKQIEEVVTTTDNLIAEQGYTTFTIVVDTLRYALVKAAKLIAAKYNAPVVGVLTDNPANISSVRSAYVSVIKKNVNNFDGYIALTDSLNRILNPKKKPFYIMEGLVDDIVETDKLPIGEYIFFGGALYERYGVRRLLEAYHRSRCKYNLVIAGAGELKKFIYDLSEKDRRILYLGLLDKNTLYSIEQHAKFNINPRPYDWKLDRESIPSKLLEYVSTGVPTISTKHSKLREIFETNIIWLDDDSERGLERYLENLDALDYDELKVKAQNAKMRVFELYGIRTQGEAITQFIKSLSSSLI